MGLCLDRGGSLSGLPLFAVESRTNATDLIRRLEGWQRQEIPWATKLAVDDVGYDIIAAQQDEMRRVFKDPRPWTLNGMKLRKADKYGGSAQVYWQETSGNTDAGRYLLPQVRGGPRDHTPFEYRLIRAGRLAESEFLVPGKFAETDRRGDMNAGQITKIISDLGGLAGLADKSKNWRNKGARRAETYVMQRSGRVPPGIYRVRAQRLELVFLIVRQPQYRAVYRFLEVAQETMARQFAPRFRERLGQAIATSRRNPLFMAKAA